MADSVPQHRCYWTPVEVTTATARAMPHRTGGVDMEVEEVFYSRAWKSPGGLGSAGRDSLLCLQWGACWASQLSGSLPTWLQDLGCRVLVHPLGCGPHVGAPGPGAGLRHELATSFCCWVIGRSCTHQETPKGLCSRHHTFSCLTRGSGFLHTEPWGAASVACVASDGELTAMGVY